MFVTSGRNCRNFETVCAGCRRRVRVTIIERSLKNKIYELDVLVLLHVAQSAGLRRLESLDRFGGYTWHANVGT